MNGFGWDTFLGVKKYKRGIRVPFPKACGMSLMPNQTISKYTAAKGKHQDILIEYQRNAKTL